MSVLAVAPSDGLRLGLDRRERGRTGGVETSGMTETTCADARAAIGIGRDVEDDVVGTRGITGHSADTRQGARGGHVVQSQKVAHAPSDIVVRTGGVPAHADTAHDDVTRGVESESSAEHIDATDLLPNHRVGSGTIVRRR